MKGEDIYNSAQREGYTSDFSLTTDYLWLGDNESLLNTYSEVYSARRLFSWKLQN